MVDLGNRWSFNYARHYMIVVVPWVSIVEYRCQLNFAVDQLTNINLHNRLVMCVRYAMPGVGVLNHCTNTATAFQ